MKTAQELQHENDKAYILVLWAVINDLEAELQIETDQAEGLADISNQLANDLHHAELYISQLKDAAQESFIKDIQAAANLRQANGQITHLTTERKLADLRITQLKDVYNGACLVAGHLEADLHAADEKIERLEQELALAIRTNSDHIDRHQRDAKTISEQLRSLYHYNSMGQPVAEVIDNGTPEGGIRWLGYMNDFILKDGDKLYHIPA